MAGLPKNFEKVVSLLDSDQPGEQAAALTAATKMLTAAGLKWRDVIKPPPPPPHVGKNYGPDPDDLRYQPMPSHLWEVYQAQEAERARNAHNGRDRIREAAERELAMRRQRDAKILKGIRNVSRTVNYVLNTHNDDVFPWERSFLDNIQWASAQELTEDQFNKYQMIVNRVLKQGSQAA